MYNSSYDYKKLLFVVTHVATSPLGGGTITRPSSPYIDDLLEYGRYDDGPPCSYGPRSCGICRIGDDTAGVTEIRH